MTDDITKRRFLLFSLAALLISDRAQAQHTDGGHSGGSDEGHSGGRQRGRPDDPHSGDDGHAEDTGDDHDHEDDHGDDHASGGKGKGPKYRGGRDEVQAGFGRGHSLEDRVLKEPHF